MRSVRSALAAFALAAVPTLAHAQAAPPAPAPMPPTTPAPEAPVGEETPTTDAPPEASSMTAAAPATIATAPIGSIGYDKGFEFQTADDKFALKITGRLQARYTLANNENAAGDRNWTEFFQIPRARLTFEGHAFGDVQYKMQTDFGKGFVFLRDFYLQKELFGPALGRAGQFKEPYSRQQITSSAYLQFPDRAITDPFSGAKRDIGVMVHDDYDKSPAGLEWAIGMFNGAGDKSIVPCAAAPVVDDMTGMLEDVDVTCGLPSNTVTDIGPELVARVGWNSPDMKGYSESDLEGGPLRYAVAASYMVNLAQADGDLIVQRFEPDFMLKAYGASLTGALYVNNGPAPTAGDPENRETDLGFFVQGGYMFVPKTYEVAARFAMIPAADDENTLEALGGFNWFWHGHALKWQTDAGVGHTTGDDTPWAFIARTQLQLIF